MTAPSSSRRTSKTSRSCRPSTSTSPTVRDVVLLDVREPHEYEINRIPGAILIPKDTLAGRLAELDPGSEYVVHCKGGVRSLESVRLLRGAGFRARSMRGGIDLYARQVDPSIPVY
jgi:sulfur-carrier protein adenylyltransferase/sulfurtransferase